MAAHKRGVKITAILDKSQQTARYTSGTFLANARVPVFIDAKHAIAHNKIIIIDGATILTGSFNFTKAAEQSNAENSLIIKNAPDIVQQYQQNFQLHMSHAVLYARLAPESSRSSSSDSQSRSRSSRSVADVPDAEE